MTSRSLRAIETLAETDPQFEDLCKVLYGEMVDPDIIWRETFGKNSPDQADLATHERSRRSRTRMNHATQVLGLQPTGRSRETVGKAGIKELAQGAYAGMKRLSDGMLNPTGGAAVKAGAVKPTKAAGAVKPAAASKAPKASFGDQAFNAGQKVGQGLEAATSTPARRLATGGALVGAGVIGAKRRSENNYYGGGGFAKLDDSQKRGLTAGASAVGAAAGLVGTAAGVAAVRRHMPTPRRHPSLRPGRLVRAKDLRSRVGVGLRKTSQLERGLLAVEPVGLAGEVSATHILHGDVKGKRRRPVAKAAVEEHDVTWGGEFSKFDVDKHLAFGWASIVELDGQPVIDRQGDFIHPDDLEESAYVYVEKSRVGGDMHRRTTGKLWRPQGPNSVGVHGIDAPHQVSTLVESMVFTPEKVEKMGLDPETIPSGWWVGFKIHDEDVWDMVKKGERTGFSIHGKGRRTPMSVDQALSYA